ncbi:hypothetical protein IMPR6_280040 [Imperialibacter sp. EC-SDR9]|nr:hypothetical protein IMPERIA89_240025 [Imperialibacter sp. 89]CAD5271814.1 hypothetical protein IMPERIA75_390025 [Imperialibacter sp. 75]VVT19061.1 hypothetical protein IMPR6_280040 [Imperialibacter sp. EC-SDR9]|tara:strand:+ start:98 stop:331 length:234 start_codon:yes stop_codon:yes gene_type:complete
MQQARNKMSTTLITLGVIVALLAVLLTPGFLDLSSLVMFQNELPQDQPLVSQSTLQEVGSQSVEAVSSFLKKVSLSQ